MKSILETIETLKQSILTQQKRVDKYLYLNAEYYNKKAQFINHYAELYQILSTYKVMLLEYYKNLNKIETELINSIQTIRNCLKQVI